MKVNKYSLPDYWKNKIQQNESFWYGLFENKPIERNSIIMQINILNPYSNQAEDGWAVYPNPQSIIGFLKYIYLPTALIRYIDKDKISRYYFSDDLVSRLEERRQDFTDKQDLITRMQTFIKELEDIPLEDDSTCLKELEKWLKKFNGDWLNEEYVEFTLNIFTSPKLAIKYIISIYEEDLDIQMLENDIGFTKVELLELASDDIYENTFMKRKFVYLLTNRLTVT